MGLVRNIKRIIRKIVRSFKRIAHLYAGKKGLEIGGPSAIFNAGGELPLYALAKQIDGCNFSSTTVWENTIQEGQTYKTGSTSTGHQYILDGIDLSSIPSSSYDFVLSSHSLEHMANPIKALKEWLRVLKPGGSITLILPDQRYNFDHNRPVATFDHLLDDYNNNTSEHDLTHLDEILLLHDYEMDAGVTDMAHFKQRSLSNIDNRCLHQHVFSVPLLKQLFKYLGLKIVVAHDYFQHHLVIVGIKTIAFV